MTNKFNRIKLLMVTGALAVVALGVVAVFHDHLWVIPGVMVALKLVSAIRYPVYSQLANDIIPSDVRATTISLLSILDSVFDLFILTTVSGMALTGFTPMLLACAVIAFIGTLIPIKPKK